MNKKKTNTNNTRRDNPFEMIQNLRIESRDDKNLFIELVGKTFKAITRNRFMAKTFDIELNYDDKKYDAEILQAFKKLKHCANNTTNTMEQIQLFVDFFNLNVETLNARVLTFPIYRESMDGKFVMKNLMKRG